MVSDVKVEVVTFSVYDFPGLGLMMKQVEFNRWRIQTIRAGR